MKKIEIMNVIGYISLELHGFEIKHWLLVYPHHDNFYHSCDKYECDHIITLTHIMFWIIWDDKLEYDLDEVY